MRKIIIPIALVALLALNGCMEGLTAEKPFGDIDPNNIQQWVDVGIGIGQTGQAVGIATGNPAFIAYGAALILVGGYVTAILKGKK